MNKDDQADNWTQRIAWTSIIAIVISGCAWCGWISIEITNKLDRSEIATGIPFPYNEDKVWVRENIVKINRDLDSLDQKIDVKLSETIAANTRAIVELREQMKYNQIMWERIIESIEKQK